MSSIPMSDASTVDFSEHVHGYFFEDLAVGMSAFYSRTVTEADIVLFAGISGDFNPLHLNREFAEKTRFGSCIAHGMLTASLISTVVGTKLPGPGAIYMSQNIRFTAPVKAQDTVTAVAEVVALDSERKRCQLDTRCLVRGENVVIGEALLLVPSREKGTF